jgi:catechol-2,3-dioxygenase
MNIQHLHLHVRDRSVAEAFYEKWLGLQVTRRGECLTFMTDGAAFDLALMQDDDAKPLPGWFHFGCKLPSAAGVESLHAAMVECGLSMAKPLYRDETLASFRVRDPDGHSIEIYWEEPGAPLD